MLDFNQSLDFMDFVALMRQKHMISTYAFVLSAGAVALTLALGGGGALLLCKRWLRLAPRVGKASANIPASEIKCTFRFGYRMLMLKNTNVLLLMFSLTITQSLRLKFI
jgi:hypothetical protein